jgi:hypothetical protein
MTVRRLLLIIPLFIMGVVLLWLPYHIHIADDAPDLRCVALGFLLPLCLFTAAVFIALGAPKRIKAVKE